MSDTDYCATTSTASDVSASASGGGGGSKRRCFTSSFKLQVVDYAKQSSVNGASNKFGVDRRCIRDWIRKEEELKTGSSSTAKRLKGAGRRIINKNFDQQLVEWVLQKRAENTRLSGRAIQQQAELFLKQIDGVDGKIKASRGWLQRFLTRHKLDCSRHQCSDGEGAPRGDTSLLTSIQLLQSAHVMKQQAEDSLNDSDTSPCEENDLSADIDQFLAEYLLRA